MTRIHVLAPALSLALVAGCATAPRSVTPPSESPTAHMETTQEAARLELARLDHQAHRWPEDRALFTAAIGTAWTLIDRHYQANTGMVTPVGVYPIATVWDIGSMLAALASARELELLGKADYDARMGRLLETLEHVPLYDGHIFNRTYDTRTGAMLDRLGKVSTRGGGWSTTDLGRLLIWLKIVGRDPAHAAAAERVVRRNDFTRAIRSGYLWGETVDRDGKTQEYQEGRLGYEQYAATGFALWGYPVGKALNLTENALPITLMGEPLIADVRRWDRLTNEPFLLLGLEAGWDRRTAALVRSLLRVQEARYRQTGIVTLPSEDASERPPFYFYYYCVFTNGKAFGIDVQDRWSAVEGPRWVSAKAAFAFHALTPTPYTDRAVHTVLPARTSRGWASGVYEATGASTNTVDINTAAVVLSAAAFERRSRPFLDPVPSRPAG